MKAKLPGISAALIALALALLVSWQLGWARQAAPQSSFVLIDGSHLQTSDMQGKVVLVQFWATSCISCVAEMPKLTDIWKRFHGRGFEVVAVAMAYDPPTYVVNFAHSWKLPFKVAIDNTGDIARQWGEVAMTPTSFLLDRHGNVVKHYVGAPDTSQLQQNIESLLM